MDIKATDIKLLREKTGAGMMDCKRALVEAEGDFAGAEKHLREWGMAGVEKRAGRATNEGRIFITQSASAAGNKASLVEIACETDFVARNEDFIAFGNKLAKDVLDKGSAPLSELEEKVKEIASIIKENITLKRGEFFQAGANEYLDSYVHGEGKVAVLVKMKADKPAAFDNSEVKTFAHDVALHIAAFSPMFLDETKPGAAWIKEQEEIFAKQVELDEKMKSKPANVVQGILKGKLRKLMAEVCLVDQGFVRDEKVSVAAAMAAVGKAAGASLSIVDFSYARVGEA